MTRADVYTRRFFEHGRLRDFCAGCYLGYRQGGYGRLCSAGWLLVNFVVMGMDFFSTLMKNYYYSKGNAHAHSDKTDGRDRDDR
jgi:hypothetical protein